MDEIKCEYIGCDNVADFVDDVWGNLCDVDLAWITEARADAIEDAKGV